MNAIHLVGSTLVTCGDDSNILVYDFLKPENSLPYHYYYDSEIDFLKKSGIFVENKEKIEPVEIPVYTEKAPEKQKKEKCLVF